MFIVSHAWTTQEFKTLTEAQEWITILLRNKAHFEVTYRY